MKLCTISDGDTAYRYDKSIVVYFQGKRKVLSTSVFNGGYHENYTTIFNHDGKTGAGMLSVSKKKMGIGIYGPSLDKKGNCIAGCELLGYISEALHLHIFDTREWKVEE